MVDSYGKMIEVKFTTFQVSHKENKLWKKSRKTNW